MCIIFFFYRFRPNIEDETTLQGQNDLVFETPSLNETYADASTVQNEQTTQSELDEATLKTSLISTELNFSENELLDKVDELNCAITSGHLGVVKLFIETNEDSVVRTAVTTASHHGESPITCACTLGLISVLEVFAHYDLLFNVPDKEGFYPIHRATYNGHVAVVRYLIGHFGKDGLDKETNSGFSALHIAASVGNGEIVKLLVEQVNNIDQKCNEGWTALHIGAQGGYLQVELKSIFCQF